MSQSFQALKRSRKSLYDKIVEERNRTLTALYKSSIRDKKRKKGVLLNISLGLPLDVWPHYNGFPRF